MQDNFVFDLVSDFVGYISSRDKTNVARNALVRGSKNMYKKRSGTIANRPGLKIRGTPDVTVAGVVASWEWENSLNTTFPLRVANSKLQFESTAADGTNPVWYDLLLTSAMTNPAVSLTRFIFDAWWDNTEKKDRLIMVRGDANILHWSGGIAKVAAQVATGATLTLSDSTSNWQRKGFASNTAGEKKFYINGSTTEYTYTGGESTATLTGITPALPTINDGDIVIQSVIIEASKPAAGFAADFVRTVGNQIYVGSYTSRLVYVSDDSDFKNFTVPTPRAPGDPELLTLDSTARGIGIRQGQACISAGFNEWYIIKFSNITVGSTLTQRTDVEKKKVSTLSAAYAHEFIDMIGDEIVYLSRDQQVLVFGQFMNLTEPKYPSLSQDVSVELTEEDFTGGHLRAIGDIIYITAPNAGRDWMYEQRESVDKNGQVVSERFWHPPQIRNIARYAVIDGVIYGHSIANPQLYQIWDTDQWHDDSPAGDNLPYTCVMRMAYAGDKNRFKKIAFDKAAFEGYMTEGTNLGSNVYMDYQGSTSLPSPTINAADDLATFYSGVSPASLGDSSLGDNPLGDGIVEESSDQELLAKFRAICDLEPKNCFEYSLEVYSLDEDARWEILSLGVNAVEALEMPSELRK